MKQILCQILSIQEKSEFWSLKLSKIDTWNFLRQMPFSMFSPPLKHGSPLITLLKTMMDSLWLHWHTWRLWSKLQHLNEYKYNEKLIAKAIHDDINLESAERVVAEAGQIHIQNRIEADKNGEYWQLNQMWK